MNEHWFTLALRYLQSRPRSVFEVRKYLQKKEIPDSSIDEIITSLLEKRFLNDSDFVRWWIDQRTRFKPKGKQLIAFELRQKGIAQSIIDKVYEKEDGEDTEIISDFEKAKQLLLLKKERFSSLLPQQRYQKVGSFLARRGFPMDVISKSIDEVFKK